METLVALALIIFAAGLRLAPHAPNFAPVGAVALFAGAVLSRRYALPVVLLTMLASDAVIGFYAWPIMVSVYASFAAIAALGLWTRRGPARFAKTAVAAASGSVLFFAVTNFAVWCFSGMYPQTARGLLAAYAMAVPFFKNTLAGDLFYSGLLFGLFAVSAWTIRNADWLRDAKRVGSRE